MYAKVSYMEYHVDLTEPEVFRIQQKSDELNFDEDECRAELESFSGKVKSIGQLKKLNLFALDVD